MNRSSGLAAALVALLLAGCGTTVPLAARTGATQSNGLDSAAAGPGALPDGNASTGGLSTSPVTPGGSTTVPTQSRGGTSTGAGNGATSASGQGAAPGPAGLPLTGRGWDAKHVYIGVPTADDFNGQIAKLGANFNNGSTEGDVNAIVADINKAGGILGRSVVAVFHNASAADYSTNAPTTAQAMCTYFSQDRQVIAVLNGSPQLDGLDSFHACLEHHQISLVSLTDTDYSTKDYARLGPHLWTAGSLSTELIVPSLVSSLKRQGFFQGWDTTNGAPGAAPAKIGILEPDNPQGHHVAALLEAQLRTVSSAKPSEYFYDPSGSGGKSQSEVLQFETDGVTHVLDLPPIEAEVLQFQIAAEAQHYRPRYGITSFDLPLSVQENSSIVPAAQQVGSMGIGWQPYNDVDAAHDPRGVPGSSRCLGALNRGGQTFTSSQRRAAFIAVLFCDGLYLLRDAAVSAKGLTGAALLNGTAAAGARLLTAGTFTSALSSQSHGVPGTYRDLQYGKACSCFAYVGGNRAFTT